jgi:hypothetical protein
MIGLLSLSTVSLDKNFCGFNSVEDMQACIQLSALLLKQSVDQVYFFTDRRGLEIIKDFKHIFDEVVTCLDDLNWVKDYNWAMSKLYAYTKMREPFVHVDIDVFLWEGLPKHFFDGSKVDYFFQNVEAFDRQEYKFYQPAINEVYHILPSKIQKTPINYSYNCGITGVNNLSLIHEHYSIAHEFVTRNQEMTWGKSKHQHHQCIIFEQYFFAVLARRSKVETLLNTDTSKKYDIKYTHLIVDAKRKPEYITQVKRRLSELLL